MGSARIGPTPNPNALKVTVDRVLVEKPMTFSSPGGHPLADALLAIPGVVSVFMLKNYATITKSPEADWDAIEPGIEEAFR